MPLTVYAAAAAMRHYWERRDIGILTQIYKDRGRTDRFLSRFDRFMVNHKRVWFVSAHAFNDERKTWTAALQGKYELVDGYESEDAAATLFVRVDRGATIGSTRPDRSASDVSAMPHPDATVACHIPADTGRQGTPN